jgi:hypothetical protein
MTLSMGKKKDKAVKLTDATPEAYEFKLFPRGTLKLDEVDLELKVEDKKAYEKELEALQERLLELQVRYFLEKRRASSSRGGTPRARAAPSSGSPR